MRAWRPIRARACDTRACDNARKAGIRVHTVSFSVSTDPIDTKGLALLQACATNPDMAKVVTNGEEIVAVFREMARNIGGLRIAQ